MTADRRLRGWLAVAVLALPIARAAEPATFDIPPARPARVLEASYFGTHFHRLGRAEHGFPATAWPDDLVGALRLWDSGTRWADVEPAPQRFDFARLDALVDAARAHGAVVTLVLGSPARWASARPDEPGPYGPGSAAEPRDAADWDRYVDAVARRYRGRIARYELWNEPYFDDLPADRGHAEAFFTGAVATMVDLARRARAVLASADPAARLLTPGFVGPAHRLDLFLQAGGARLVDGVAYHFYAEDDAAFVRRVAEVRAVMARDGVAGLPLSDTESGFAIRGVEGQPASDGAAPVDRRRAAALLARTMILGAFLGLDQFDQYAWDNGRMGMLLPDGRTATGSLRAFVSVRRWLLGATLDGCRPLAGRGVRCDARRGGEREIVAWRTDADAGALALDLPRDAPSASTTFEHAVDADRPTPDTGTARVTLPADGMPIAIRWTPAAARRHTGVTRSR